MKAPIALRLTKDQKTDLVGYLYNKFEQSVKARTNQIEDKYRRWVDNYAGKPKEAIRITPYYNASNFVPHLIRMHCDILAARMICHMFAPKPFWRSKVLLGNIDHTYTDAVNAWMEYESFYNMGLYQILDRIMVRTIKLGTQILKTPWVEDSFWNVTSIDQDGNYDQKEVLKEGLKPQTVPFDDFFVWPITCNDLNDARIKFHRLRFTKEEVEYRQKKGWWEKEACNLLLTHEEETSKQAAAEAQSIQAGIQLTKDVARPFSAIEAWLEWNIGGNNYRVITVFNPFDSTSKGYLKGIFNPSTTGADDFIDFRIMERDDLFYGYAMPEILEQYQEEQAQIHNVRRDASVICNIPGWKTKRYADVPNPSSEWYPGKVFVLHDTADLEPLQFQTKYQSMVEEEKFLLELAERASGISPPMQGMGAGVLTGKRGIYNTGGTLALISEGNRRLDVYQKRTRYSFNRLGNNIYQKHRDNRPNGLEYDAMGPKGELIKQSFKFLEPEGYQGLFFGIAAADASNNKEVDRTGLMMVANTMASYYQRMVECVQTITSLPENNPIRTVMLQIVEGARDLANRLLFAFDVGDQDKLVPDLRKILQGGGGGQAPGMGPSDLPPAEGSVSVENLANLAQQLGSVQTGLSPGNGEGAL